MPLLKWLPGRPEDRDALRTFQCTPNPTKPRGPFGPRKPVHKAPHEQRVQSMIRQDLKPARVPHQTTLLGWVDETTLGGVVSYRSIGSQQKFHIDVIAVALGLRGRGGAWAREALKTGLDYITADVDAHGYHAAVVAATIHEDNRPSQRLFAQERFEVTEQELDRYQTWALDLIVGGGMFDDIA